MKSLIRIITTLFSPKEKKKQEKIPEENLPVYNGKIEVDKYMEFKYIVVEKSQYFQFKTPDEILKILNKRNLLWIDVKNDLLGYSNEQRSKLFILSEVTGFEIQNMLPAKGGGGSWILVCFANGTSCEIAEAGQYSFDEYADEISKVTNLPVTFLPEYYNC